ncbi:unnamed protein product [Clonostachys rhizophaga]|uniref:Uncharacterized protein n=1 Tax=Clonostachys rhizophaga TaxID=160324 RepID=A0A9N9W1A3_9HYPO|nr:unnamed protein product [Clonostachys rhizophaga]
MVADKDKEVIASHDIREGKTIESTEPDHEVLHRVHNMWTASAYQVLMMASWTCNIVMYGTVFDLGGPMMLIYSTIIVCIGQCLLMSSLAEMCAVWPYSGGQQAFTKYLAPVSSGWVGIMSFYSPLYALYGTDGILHIAEEMKDAHRTAPKAMILSMVLSSITSIASAIIIGFCCGNWEDYMTTDIPYISWFVDTLDSIAGGIAFLTIIIVLLNFLIVVGINTAVSRLAWGMARDNALPFSRIFVKINPTVQTPLNAIFLAVVIEMALGLIAFGSDYAFEAIISFGQVALQIGFLIPVLMFENL